MKNLVSAIFFLTVQLFFSQQKKDSPANFQRIFGNYRCKDSLVSAPDSILYFLKDKHKTLVALDLRRNKTIWQSDLKSKLKLSDKEFEKEIEYFNFFPYHQLSPDESWKRFPKPLKEKRFIIQFHNKDFITVNAADGNIVKITEHSKNGFLQRDTIRENKNAVFYLKDFAGQKKKIVSVKIGAQKDFFKTEILRNIDFVFSEETGELTIISERLLIPGWIVETEWN